MSATKLHDAGFTALVSVTPPDAEISPRSNLSPGARGKAPGIMTDDAWWVGYPFTTQTIEPKAIDAMGANVGLLAREYPGLDIDVEDPQLAQFVQQEADKVLGPAPIRTSREPRRLLVYRTDSPFTKIRCKIQYKGQEHVVEMLADGQQYVVHGRHPSGVDYGWEGPALWEWGNPPYPVTCEQVLEFFTHLKRRLKGRAEVQIVGTGESSDALAPPQEELLAPSRDALVEAVACIPNDMASREEYVRFGHAVKAAGSGLAENVEYIFQEWAGRWVDGTNDPETVAADWRRMRPPYRVGWPWLLELAQEHGYNAAQAEFTIDPDAVAPASHSDSPVDDGVLSFTDTWVVEKIASWLKDTLRFIPEAGNWHIWSGGN